MRFLAYTPVTDDNVLQRLGTADYSYYFVMKGFLPLLEELGEVIPISDPYQEADLLYQEALDAGEQCRLLCFCPPNSAPVGLRCPTTVVVAWEFQNLPIDPWDGEPRNNWHVVLNDHGNLITLSTDTQTVVRRELGEDFPVTAIPIPVVDRVPTPKPAAARKPPTQLEFDGYLIDSRQLSISEERVSLHDTNLLAPRAWDGRKMEMMFTSEDSSSLYLSGFYHPEPWGTWSQFSEPWIVLPFQLTGDVELRLKVAGHGTNVGRTIEVVVGSFVGTATLTSDARWHTYRFHLNEPTHTIAFRGLDVRANLASVDIRTMALGLVALEVKKRPPGLRGLLPQRKQPPLPEPVRPPQMVELSGVVYTSVLNPLDGRKNWEEILRSFAYALGDRPDATLVLKLTHHSLWAYYFDLMDELRLIGPTQARIVALQSHLPQSELNRLMGATSFYVNASRGEGLCLPLMEFMSAGVPAIAPRHTAMTDYLTADSAFIVEATLQSTRWPADPSTRLRTTYYRINQESLVAAFRKSYEVATGDPDGYRRMSEAARLGQEKFCNDERVRDLIVGHLALVGDQ